MGLHVPRATLRSQLGTSPNMVAHDRLTSDTDVDEED
jgi:hypothetical protein